MPLQVQTVYRLLVRAEPALLERLCMAITESEAGTNEAEETEANVRKRKDETSRVLVYNSYIYPTLGKRGRQHSCHRPPSVLTADAICRAGLLFCCQFRAIYIIFQTCAAGPLKLMIKIPCREDEEAAARGAARPLRQPDAVHPR